MLPGGWGRGECSGGVAEPGPPGGWSGVWLAGGGAIAQGAWLQGRGDGSGAWLSWDHPEAGAGRARRGEAGPGSERAGRGWRRVCRSPGLGPRLGASSFSSSRPQPGGWGPGRQALPGSWSPGPRRSRCGSFIVTFWSRSCAPRTSSLGTTNGNPGARCGPGSAGQVAEGGVTLLLLTHLSRTVEGGQVRSRGGQRKVGK